ncbi:MAG: hypothetical protein N2645_20970 [Clostridia bacterium]|nr:hypothetical protein [Clostridia bacterium]
MGEIILEGVEKVSVINRPIPVPYNYRIMYKIAQLVLIMGICCRNKGCSLEKLHMISVALTTNNEIKKFLSFINGTSKEYTLIRFDPSVNRALNFSLAEKIIYRQNNGLLRLTEKGKSFFAEILKDEELLWLEKDNLKKIGTSLTEDKIKALKVDWRIISD